MKEFACGAALLAFTVLTVWFNHPAPSTNGLQPVSETGADFHLLRHRGDGDGTLTVTAAPSDLGHSARFVLDDGRLYWPDDETPDAGLSATVRPSYYFADSTKLDLGAWGAYNVRGRDSTGGRFQAGLRYSPVRLFYGIAAPDIVASEDVIGIGVSLYLPPRLVGRYIGHVGIGGWYAAPFDGGDEAWMYGLTFSTH